jgi:hypothetical protein
MPGAYIFNEHLSASDRASLGQLLARYGYDPIYHIPDDLSGLDPEVDLGIVCLPIAAADQTTIAKRVGAFVAAGIRVISIWLHDEGSLPEVIKKFGFSSIRIDSPEVEKVFKREPVWEEASGAPRASQPVPRNKCK